MIFQTFSPEELIAFFLVFVRLSVLVALMPLVGDKVVPMQVKILLALAFSAVVFPFLKETGAIQLSQAIIYTQSAGNLVLALIAEVLSAVIIGFASQLVFHAIHAAGDLMAQFMGLSMATAYDPHFESQTGIVSQLLSTLAMLTFLSLDGHHVVFQSMISTFRFIPLGQFVAMDALKTEFFPMTSRVLMYGVQLAAPMAACLLLVNIVYGILGKALPQLNLLTLSMASGAFIGSFILIVTYPGIQSGISNLFTTHTQDLLQLMRGYGGK